MAWPNLNFDNRFISDLPVDHELKNFPRQVIDACYSLVHPKKFDSPELISHSLDMLKQLDIPQIEAESNLFLEVFSGKTLLKGMQPYATCYGGHQFGHWANQLGDGRAINLGEIINSQGRRWAIQLKGSGLTPYSRSADGLAVLRSSIREYICSEAMHYLGVPTTRALSLITTGEKVLRDMFYDGNSEYEPGAVVCRVAPSFIRFGHFQIWWARERHDILEKVLNHTLTIDFPEIGIPNKKNYIRMFRLVCQRTSELLIHWMRVGFVHGVMNTDNMSILGLTIDYGPYGWMEEYDADWTPNTTDFQGRRYAFDNQISVAYWNLGQLASALYSVVKDKESLEFCLEEFKVQVKESYENMMSKKIGLKSFEKEQDTLLISELLSVLSKCQVDWTIFFRKLSDMKIQTSLSSLRHLKEIKSFFGDAFYGNSIDSQLNQKYLIDWLATYSERLKKESSCDEERKLKMNKVNPKYIFRNYLAVLATEKALKGDYSMVAELMELLKNPYEEQDSFNYYAKKRPAWADDRPGCSMLSCSS